MKTPPKPLSRGIAELEPGSSLSGLTGIIANDPSVDGYIWLVEVSNAVITRRI
jgi:hypothetical protein